MVPGKAAPRTYESAKRVSGSRIIYDPEQSLPRREKIRDRNSGLLHEARKHRDQDGGGPSNNIVRGSVTVQDLIIAHLYAALMSRRLGLHECVRYRGE